MKKTRFNATLLVFLITLFSGCLISNAQNCSTSVDKFCKAFDNMSKTMKSVKSFEQFDTVDFSRGITQSGVESIPDECGIYVLTGSDKTKINKSFNNFVDTVCDKTVELGGGLISRSAINSEMNPMRDKFKKALDESKTLGDLVNVLDNLF